ncbi:MAG: DNA polymerase III subunit delta [Dethiobacteria bacterium]|nr:DNA polymerase III subunit delta [Dethiobacteria bacterium]
MFTYHAALKQILEKSFFPVYLLYGEEKYLQEELVRQLTISFLGDDADVGLEKIDGGSHSFEQILAIMGESGLFAKRRLLVVDNPPYLRPPRKNGEAENSEAGEDKSPLEEPHADILSSYLEQHAAESVESVLIFLAPKVDRRKRLYKMIDKQGVSVECANLKGDALSAWIKEKAHSLGKIIDRAAVERLLLAGEQNLHYLSAELEKYCTYLAQDEQVITAKTVDTLFSGDVQGNIFKLTDALSEGDLAGAQDLLALLLKKREKPLLILFMLARHYRLLLEAFCLHDEGLPQKEFNEALGVHPFVARKLREQAALLSRHILEEALLTLQDADRQIKTGLIEPAQALALILNRVDYVQKASGSNNH